MTDIKLTLKQIFWGALFGRVRVVDTPRYQVMEDVLYAWVFIAWMHAKRDYRRLPKSYDVPMITIKFLEWLMVKIAACTEWLIRREISKRQKQLDELNRITKDDG